MTSNLMNSQDCAQLERLYDEFSAAVRQAASTLQEHGALSSQFVLADQAASALWRRIREQPDGSSESPSA